MLGDRYSQKSFAQIPDVKVGRSYFDMSYTVKDTFDFDYLVPVFLQEVIPGDTFSLRVASFARLATQLVPIMDNMKLQWYFFFCPNRLVYDNWEKLNGAQDNPGDSIDFIMPQMTFPAGGPEVGSLADKFGLPTDIAAGYTIKNCTPFRVYNLTWNQWFRDQNLQDSVVVDTDAGPDDPADYVLLKKNKAHDYFTSMLPWPQKGDPVDMPLGTSAPVNLVPYTTSTNPMIVKYSSTDAIAAPATVVDIEGTTSYLHTTGTGNGRLVLDPNGRYEADLTDATAATINDLRQAFMVQSLLELDARGGTRYVEILRSHFGVVSPDFRLQRVEYLGGGQVSINSHPVAQTSPTSGSDAQAQLAAYSTASSTTRDGIGFSKSFVEHGVIIGLVCATADITYQQGVNRFWNRSTRYDFFWPKLQQMGEQAVFNSEWYVQGTAADDAVAGYQERYADLRYRPSEIHGEFRSTYATSLDFWHLAEEFGSLPTLSSAFIQSNTPIARAIAINTEPHLLHDVFFKLQGARPLMANPQPATLGRF